MELHALKYSVNIYIDSRVGGLSKSFTGRHILFYDGITKELRLIDTYLDVEKCLNMVGFPQKVSACLFYWLHDRIWHVMFTLQDFAFGKNIRQFYGKACMDIDADEIILLNSHEIDLQGQDLLYNFYQLDDGISRYWIWIQRRYFELSRSIEIFKCKLTGAGQPERILSLDLDEFEQQFYITMVTLLGQNCCYFLKSFGRMYLPDTQICFLEEFHFYDMIKKKHQVRRTRPLPSLDDDLESFSIDTNHLWYFSRLHLLFKHKMWGEIVGNFMHNLLIFDAYTLTWTKMEFSIGDLLGETKLVYLDSSGVLTVRVRQDQTNNFSFYRCPLKQPDKLIHLAWFKYKQLNNFRIPPTLIDTLPESFKSPVE